MIKKCGIYKITNIIDGKMIIGLSSNIFSRWWQHKKLLRKNKHYNSYLQNAWNKYGEQNFVFEILLECPEEKLNEEEIRLIKEYSTTKKDKGYNILIGGDRSKHTVETKNKIRLARLGKNYLTPNIRQKIGEILSLKFNGKSNPMYGKHHSDETKTKISYAHLSENLSQETRQRMSASAKCKIFTDTHKQNISKSCKGKMLSGTHKQNISKALKGQREGTNNPNYGKRRSQEAINKARETRKRNLS